MFFYHKACQMADGKEVNINDFRYDGRRPTTREAAIVMLADTVEAAVRSMQDPTPEKIRAFIEKLVRGKLDDGQLSNAPLTLRDIQQIIEAFCTVLHGVFHERIEYPNVEVPHREVPLDTSADPRAEEPAAAAATESAGTSPAPAASPVTDAAAAAAAADREAPAPSPNESKEASV